MNTQARKLNLIENLMLFQDEKVLDEIEKFFASLHPKQNETAKTKKNLSAYKKSILSVSVWSHKDIELLENNLKSFNAWKIEKW